MLKWAKIGLVTPVVLSCFWLGSTSLNSAQGQSRSLTLRADIQQANAKTGVVTASGNVQLSYPARQIQATSAQAQYYSRERRIILSGNVYVLQAGNSLRAETITYLIDEGRFVAVNDPATQVEAVIVVEDQDVPIVDN
ncbi:Lipopolysaccharide export system protein LptA [Acaryochloris thomasi RCC1774]|uniref:Lipopolysaccharide export system protein LptA n=1 Tax=Acaryochloris thomasi RCC1774 TaxID=1764569 RepID=A0A2W1JZR2_9CYAN|nr:LptA/OstA family protein [Acaryochloris thomasi]PZD74864.1 Lipopolysaccharide export system protein LptA [Acaryochloris thomasi RCC1774]